MSTLNSKILPFGWLAIATMTAFAFALGCAGESDGAALGDGSDAAEVPRDGESRDAEASIEDAASDRRIAWDSGEGGEVAVVSEMWTRGSVYCARVARSAKVTVECWGMNASGELGRGTVSKEGTTFRPFPIASSDAPAFTKVVNSGNYMNGATCAVTAAHDLKCWGGNYDGMSPVGPTVPSTPVLSNVADVAMAEAHACAVSTSGRVSCWGGNVHGQLGVGVTDYVTHTTPEEIPGFAADHVVCGAISTCAWKDGSVWCWGFEPMLGTGGFGWNPTPTRVAGVVGIDKVQIGYDHVFVRKGDKTLWFWGTLGSTFAELPAQVLDPTPDDASHVLEDVEELAGDCVRLTSGRVRCLSVTRSGEYRFNEVPRVPDAVLLGDQCALNAAGLLRCWGDNTFGRLGVAPSSLFSSTPALAIQF